MYLNIILVHSIPAMHATPALTWLSDKGLVAKSSVNRYPHFWSLEHHHPYIGLQLLTYHLLTYLLRQSTRPIDASLPTNT